MNYEQLAERTPGLSDQSEERTNTYIHEAVITKKYEKERKEERRNIIQQRDPSNEN